MPIYSLEGTPGSGKTLYCVQKIIPDFLRIRDQDGNIVPKHIYTNIDGLRPELICAWLGLPEYAFAEYFHVLGQAVDKNGKVYEDKDLVRWWFYKPETIEWVETLDGNKRKEKIPNMEKAEVIPLGSLVIIDELQNYYGARDFAQTVSRSCIDYITKNRHYGWTLFWMSQSVDSVDVTFRRNTQYVYFLESKENYGFSKSASVKKYEGWLSGEKTMVKPFATDSFHYDKKYFAAYNSYFKGVKGEVRYKTNVFLANKGLVAVCVIVLLCLVSLIFNNPISAIVGESNKLGSKGQKQTATATATATPSHLSFSGVTGGAVVTPSRDDGEDSTEVKPCYVNKFVSFGEIYVVLLNGKTRKVNVGDKYEECQ